MELQNKTTPQGVCQQVSEHKSDEIMGAGRWGKFVMMGGVLAAAGALVSCDGYTTPSEYSAVDHPLRKVKKEEVPSSRNLKPAAKFPARIAMVKVETGYSGNMSLSRNQHVERAEYAKTLGSLPGIAGMVNMNNTMVRSNRVSYASLRKEARNLGADLVAIYKFNTSTHTNNVSTLLSVATLGAAPTNGHRSVSAVSLLIMDARTGYVYGVEQASAEKRALSTSWGNDGASDHAEFRAEQVAMDEIMKKVPGFWKMLYAKHGEGSFEF